MQYCKWISWHKTKEKIYIFDERSNEMFVLKGVAAIIWTLIGTQKSCNMIEDILVNKYSDIDRSVICADLNAFLKKMVEMELLANEKG